MWLIGARSRRGRWLWTRDIYINHFLHIFAKPHHPPNLLTNGRLPIQTLPTLILAVHARCPLPARPGPPPVLTLRPALPHDHRRRLLFPDPRHRHPVRAARQKGQTDDQGGGVGLGQGSEAGGYEGGVLPSCGQSERLRCNEIGDAIDEVQRTVERLIRSRTWTIGNSKE